MPINISKLDAARRQLEVAVRLFFLDGDPVAIHTLAGAAGGLLRDLARDQGLQGGLFDAILEHIRPEKRAEVRADLHEAQNFFKHADRDPGELLRFDTDINSFYLFDVCELYRAVTSERVPLFRLCTLHFEMSFPHLIDDETAKAQVETALLHLDPRNKFKFLELLPKLERMMMGL
jgi:hypothetical protein